MEQQHPAAGHYLAQAARTVLPGEPFEPPVANSVPTPRSHPETEPQPGIPPKN